MNFEMLNTFPTCDFLEERHIFCHQQRSIQAQNEYNLELRVILFFTSLSLFISLALCLCLLSVSLNF